MFESIRLISLHPKTPVFSGESIELPLADFLEKRAGDLGVCRLALYPRSQMSSATTVVQSERGEGPCRNIA